MLDKDKQKLLIESKNLRIFKLTSLINAPKIVAGNFGCSYNDLTSLVGAPKTVGGDFYCGFNNLTSLEGAPKSVGLFTH